MTSQSPPACAQCGAPIRRANPVVLGDELFCCVGCVGGGSCLCSRRASAESFVLFAGPFPSQAAMLSFATRLERSHGLQHVDMTLADVARAQFVVVAASAEALVQAVAADPEYSVTIEVSGSTVDARLAVPQRRAEDTAGAAETLLPTRTRFRVFRTAGAVPDPASDFVPVARPRIRERLESNPAAQRVRDGRSARPPTPEQRTGNEILILASPFPSFVELDHFHSTMRAQPGVLNAKVLRFYDGALEMMVEYTNPVSLAERLGAYWHVVSATPRRIVINMGADARQHASRT